MSLNYKSFLNIGVFILVILLVFSGMVLAEQTKVAMLFNGSISDQGWNQYGYEKLMELKEEYDLQVSHQEGVPNSEVRGVLRSYAADGYDLIISHELYFTEQTIEVAGEFPETMFAVTLGYKKAPNVAAITTTNWQNTYLAGTLAGLVTETDHIGILTATDSPIAQTMVEGFLQGAKEGNPDVEVHHAYVGSWTDVVRGKELVKSMINEGADVVYTQCGEVNIGAIKTCKEEGVYAIGAMVDLSYVAPEIVLGSAVAPPGALVEDIVEMYLNGELEGEFILRGVKHGAEDLVLNPKFKEEFSDEILNTIDRVRQDIIDGKITKPEI